MPDALVSRQEDTTAMRYVSPPNWPEPPSGWSPLEGWAPPAAWPPSPPGWRFWVDDETPVDSAPAAAASPRVDVTEKVPMFGARQRAHKLADELALCRQQMADVGALDVVELQHKRDALTAEISGQRERMAAEATAHSARLRELTDSQVVDAEQQLAGIELQITETTAQISGQQERLAAEAAVHSERLRELTDSQVVDAEKLLAGINSQIADMTVQLAELSTRVVVTEEAVILQEVGVYQYRHPLTDAAAYQQELSRLQDSIKAMTRRDGGAIESMTSFTLNGSAAQGRAMIRDFSKLMLRAYNAEAENLVRGLKPYKLATSIDRLDKVAKTIERLCNRMNIQIAMPYHQLRIKELELTADFLEKLAVDKEREREEKARLREERLAEAEMQRERARLENEKQHYLNALAALEAKNDAEGVTRLLVQLENVDKAITDVDYRVANIRAGYVYVISNVGSFGNSMIKVGMTRRLDPRDRVRELSDASVPFNFDVHALFFSADAVGIETKMHKLLAGRRVNRINHRREFFYATAGEARAHLLALTGEMLEFTEIPEAVEFQQSQTTAVTLPGGAQGRHLAPEEAGAQPTQCSAEHLAVTERHAHLS